MRQALNQVTIEGILNEVDLAERTDSNGRNYISGTVSFLVRQTVAGIPEEDHVPVRVFAYELTRAGKKNPAYTNAYELLHSGVSIRAAGGEEGADCYRVSGASLRQNSFVGRDGNEVNYTAVQGSFFQKVPNCNNVAKFSVEPIIWGMSDEIKDDVPTGRLFLDTVIIQYGDTPDSVRFVVEDANAVDYIKSNYAVHDTVKVEGKLRFTSKVETYTSNEVLGFGEADTSVREKTVKEFVITSGSAGPLDEEYCYNIAEVNQAIEAKKLKMQARNSAPKAPAAAPRVTRGF